MFYSGCGHRRLTLAFRNGNFEPVKICLVFDTFHNPRFLKVLCFFAALTIFSSAISSPESVIGQTDETKSDGSTFHSYNYKKLRNKPRPSSRLEIRQPKKWNPTD